MPILPSDLMDGEPNEHEGETHGAQGGAEEDSGHSKGSGTSCEVVPYNLFIFRLKKTLREGPFCSGRMIKGCGNTSRIYK